MVLFGFPEYLSQYEAKHYLRLVVIVLIYLTFRPLFLKIGEKIQNSQLDQNNLRKTAQEAKERDERELEEKVAQARAAEAESSALKQKASKLKSRKSGKKSKAAAKVDRYGDMPSDDDVSDLLDIAE